MHWHHTPKPSTHANDHPCLLFCFIVFFLSLCAKTRFQHTSSPSVPLTSFSKDSEQWGLKMGRSIWYYLIRVSPEQECVFIACKDGMQGRGLMAWSSSAQHPEAMGPTLPWCYYFFFPTSPFHGRSLQVQVSRILELQIKTKAQS